ncbi:16S rRNA (guanine(527)-N(7))-methyltransferase RsmG [Amycolatopsis aidingensis]|uniref:16S rRNA (guanine(527)-N(7))-methyltransferase RsmG n=1 Tax=Amycolatopsis aidingensis TaxID=2842453 RepID=UPI001C0B030A|nr:16S rRNA (guanine(527)-N(7))-methyltransferase RsmG [Amycolatopsis aidingensis]
MGIHDLASGTPAIAGEVFGANAAVAERYVDLLRRHGVERGLIGPRETDRLWERHVLNSAVIGERIPEGARVVDVGSGAGLPGVPLAIARPDLDMVLLEPMARRVDWLTEVAQTLELPLAIERGRAEERAVRERIGSAEVVTARAVAPLGRLAGWCLPLVRAGGTLLAMKGASVAEEVDRDRVEIQRAGGSTPQVVECGQGLLEPATIVALIERRASTRTASGRRRR